MSTISCVRTAALALLLSVVKSFTTELSFQIEPQQEQCLYEQVPEGAEVDTKVMVYRGGKLDVRMRVEAPDGRVLYNALLFSNLNEKGKMLDTIVKKGTVFKAQVSGVYAFCLDNRMAKYTAKGVVFDVDVRDPNSPAAKAAEAAAAAAVEGADGSRPSTEGAQASVDFMRTSTQRIMGKLYQIADAQLYHYHRERRHRLTVESTNDRLNWWSTVETIVVVLLPALQIFSIRWWVKNSDVRLPSFRV